MMLIGFSRMNVRKAGHWWVCIFAVEITEHIWGGASFYDDDVYLRFMQQIEGMFPNVAFYLSSDEPLSDDYKKYHITEKNGNSAAYDMYALSKCDYIIGPGSTFSGWASFIGKNKLRHIESKDEILTISSFVTGIRESLCE